ncbi:MAG: hypothetical protein ABII07_02745 [Patescibacteria group bacterium]|nr:hypothetical protein [Patescibacteria group bacterium]
MPLEKRSVLADDCDPSKPLLRIPPLFFIKNARDTGGLGLRMLAFRARLAELVQDGYAKRGFRDPDGNARIQEMIKFLKLRNPDLEVFETVDPEFEHKLELMKASQ